MTFQHDKPKRWLPWRFSLRTLLLLLAVFAVIAAFTSPRTRYLHYMGELAALEGDWGKMVLKEDRAFRQTQSGIWTDTMILISPNTSPKRISFAYADEDWMLQGDHGVYKIEGDTLTLCLTSREDPPAEFRQDADAGWYLYKLKRIGPATDFPLRRTGKWGSLTDYSSWK